jgi:hypothetical protein
LLLGATGRWEEEDEEEEEEEEAADEGTRDRPLQWMKKERFKPG